MIGFVSDLGGEMTGDVVEDDDCVGTLGDTEGIAERSKLSLRFWRELEPLRFVVFVVVVFVVVVFVVFIVFVVVFVVSVVVIFFILTVNFCPPELPRLFS